jgi:hypothetical protein
MIWRPIRYVLIAASVVGLICFFYFFRTLGPPAPSERCIFALPIFFLLNIAYLLFSNERRPSRMSGLLSLWLDAKEAELRKRARENSN